MKYDMLLKMMPIIYPSFYSLLDDNGNELVFLDLGDRFEEPLKISDKTQFEAFENHFHLFDKIGEANRELAISIGKTIANNLLKTLAKTYPTKKFIVYLEVDVKESVIIRFHQIWDGEPPYIDVRSFRHASQSIFEFKS